MHSLSKFLGRLLALAATLPLLGFWIGRPLGDALVATLLFALPLGFAARAKLRADEEHLVDEAAWLTALAGALITPLLPAMLRVDGFDAPVFVALGALTFLGLRGRLTRLTAAPRWGRAARVGFVVWAAWSLGSAVRGVIAHTPVGTPWLAEELWTTMTGGFGQVSMVSAAAPLSALCLRLLLIAFAWSGFELALRALGRGEGRRFEARLVRTLAWGLTIGLLLGAAAFVEESLWRGESPVERLGMGLARNPRPLLDHNALGSVLTLLLPLVCLGAWRACRQRWALGLAAGIGLALLVSSRSKSALAGTLVAFALCALFLAWSRGGRWRKLSAGLVAAGAIAITLFNVAPASTIERISQNRYGHDLVRVVRFDAARAYLRENRAAVWQQARGVADEAPVLGVGLGRLPYKLVEHHDKDAPGWFKPLHENAHSQYLQWRSEEGWLGLALALGCVFAALVGGLRRRSSRSLAASAGLAGLAVNLLVGHALLVSSVALVFAGFVGWLLAGGSMTRDPDEAAEAAGQRRFLAPVCGLGAFLLALAPLASAERPTDLTRATYGCYPWESWPGRTPARGRAVGPDARWFETWGAGDVLKYPVADFRDPRFATPTTLDVYVNGVRVIAGHPLIHRAQLAQPNRTNYLRIERPQGVAEGDRVRIEVIASQYFVGTRAFGHDNRRVSFKMSPGFFSQARD